jgi:hypothetical protein
MPSISQPLVHHTAVCTGCLYLYTVLTLTVRLRALYVYMYLVHVQCAQVNKLQAELDTAGQASSALLLKLDGLERENKRLRSEVHYTITTLVLLH